MDHLDGLPMDYLKWTTLKFVTNINLMMLELKQKFYLSDKQNYRKLSLVIVNQQTQVTELFQFERFMNKQCDQSELTSGI